MSKHNNPHEDPPATIDLEHGAIVRTIAPARSVARSAPDFTSVHCTQARRRIAAMLASGIPLPTVAVLFGMREHELQFAAIDASSPAVGKSA